MNNYVLFDKLIKCSVVEDTSKYNLIFKRWKKKFKYFDQYKKFLANKNKSKSNEQLKSYVNYLLEKEEAKKEKLKNLGINYNYPGFVKIINLTL